MREIYPLEGGWSRAFLFVKLGIMKSILILSIGCVLVSLGLSAAPAPSQVPTIKFKHPGIGLNREQLDNLKRWVDSGVQPWKANFDYLTQHDHRFSKKPRVFSRAEARAIDNPDFDNRCMWDSQTAFCQAVMYELTGEACYREFALERVRWFYRNIKSGRPHWDSQFRWPNAERWYIMAAEMLRYTGPKTGPLAWTDEDTKGVNAFIEIGKDFWWGRGTFLNQLQFCLGGPMARAIWHNDSAAYAEAAEILTSNKHGPKGECNGSIEQMCRLMTTNEVDGVKVKNPYVQFIEMGRDIGHPFPGSGALADNLTIVQSQGTRVDPVTGEVSTKANSVLPIEFLGHRFLRGVNQICKYNLGFDLRWTPVYFNRREIQASTLPWGAGGGRGRIVNVMDVLYNHYRYVRNLPFARSEETRYFGYGKCIGGNDVFYEFLFMPPEAEGKWVKEWIDPGHDGKNWFAEFIQPKMEGLSTVSNKVSKSKYISLKNEHKLMFPMFLKSRKPLPKA